jgi:hypothetical protein
MSKGATKAQPETPDSVVPGASAVAAAEQRVHSDFFFILHLLVCLMEVSFAFARAPNKQVEPGAADAAAAVPSMCVGECTGGAPHDATMHCLECGEDYCDQEVTSHRRLKATRDHTLVPVAEKDRAVSTLCRMHPDEKLKSYCATCASPVCILCVAETHIPAQLVDPTGPADGPKHKVISLVEAGRATDASLQQIHTTVSGLATAYGATAAVVQVSVPGEYFVFVLGTEFGTGLSVGRPPCAMLTATETRP